jgi:hypothetical protein
MPTNIIERAYQLAPECTSLEEIRYKLKKERYSSVEEHLQGGSIPVCGRWHDFCSVRPGKVCFRPRT